MKLNMELCLMTTSNMVEQSKNKIPVRYWIDWTSISELGTRLFGPLVDIIILLIR